MKLYIRIKDGKPFEHPIIDDNFCQAFPNVDVNNLPPEFACFVRKEPPSIGVYEKNLSVSYQFIDGVWTDVYSWEQMSLEEKLAKQNLTKQNWANNGFQSWVFNEEKCCFDPPVPYPQDGSVYDWDESSTSWKVKT